MLRRYLPIASVYYAVKANPAPEIVAMLAERGRISTSPAAAEIALCLDNGATPERLSFGNTIKKERDIAFAYEAGVRLFAFDSEAELEKLARVAPGARVFCRILVVVRRRRMAAVAQVRLHPRDGGRAAGQGARRLASTPMASRSMSARSRPISASGTARSAPRPRCSRLLAETGIDLRMVNIGGGFPAQYRGDVSPVESYAGAVTAALTRHFGNHLPEVIVEPGRSLVGDAGMIQSEVVLISDKGDGDERRWVYLDVGKFNGLAETMDESIKYRIEAPGRSGAPAPVVIAGPTCDSADILYEKTEYQLPLDLAGRRQGRDPVDRRLYVELRLGRVQRLPADPDLLHLGAAAPAASGANAISSTSLRSIASAKVPMSCATSTNEAPPPITLWR